MQGGLARVGAVAHAAVRVGWESHRRHRLPGGLDGRSRRARLRGGGRLHPRGRPLRRLDRAVALRPRDAGDPGHGLVGGSAIRARRRIERGRPSSDKGCRRGIMTAHWALGYVTMSRGELDDATAVLTDALEFGIDERGDRAHPAAAVGPGRGRAPGRRSEAGPRSLPRRPCPRGRGRRASAADALRGHRRAGGAAGGPAGRGRELARGVRRAARPDPRCRGCARSTTHGGSSRSPRARPGSRASPSRRPSTAGTGTGASGRPPGRGSTWPIA